MQLLTLCDTIRIKISRAFKTQQSKLHTTLTQFSQIGNHLALTQRVKHPVVRNIEYALFLKGHKNTQVTELIQTKLREKRSGRQLRKQNHPITLIGSRTWKQRRNNSQ